MKRFSILLIFLIALSLPLSAQESKDSPSGQQGSDIAEILKLGDYNKVDEWYNKLSKRVQKGATALAYATISATNSYNIPNANELLKTYNNLRIRDKKEEDKRTAVEGHLDKVSRLLSNLRTVDTHEIIKAPLPDLLKCLQSQSAYLGETTPNSYTTPDGKLMWKVALSTDSLPCFKLIHRLANGVWDERNAEWVSIKGLPDGVTISHPFLLSDGSTLYFSLEQEGLTPSQTLGGKDIYVSRYDRANNILLVPTQLPLPFNSPQDDIYYRIDEQADLGWLISSRNASTDSLTLYTFAPSSVQRYEGEDTQKIAKWINPKLTPRAPKENKHQRGTKQKEAPYFWIGNRAITSSEDLPQGKARTSFTKYLQLYKAYIEQSQAIEKSRAKLMRQPSLGKDPQRCDQIITMEERLERLRIQLHAIRNEVIEQAQRSR